MAPLGVSTPGVSTPGVSTPKPVLCFGSAEPQDLLTNAASVCVFLGDIADQFGDNSPNGGLSEIGATGLSMVLESVVTTINTAMEGM